MHGYINAWPAKWSVVGLLNINSVAITQIPACDPPTYIIFIQDVSNHRSKKNTSGYQKTQFWLSCMHAVLICSEGDWQTQCRDYITGLVHE